jgi:hypothetical protein
MAMSAQEAMAEPDLTTTPEGLFGRGLRLIVS